MGARHHARGGLFGGQHRADRKTAAEALGQGHHIGRHAGPFIGPHLAGAAHATLHLVEDQQGAKFIGGLAQAVQIGVIGRENPALALHWLDHDGRDIIAHGGAQFVQIAKRHMLEPAWSRAETFAIFVAVASRQGGQGAAMKSAAAGDHPLALRFAIGKVIFARDFQRAFHRLGPGIAEKHGVGEGVFTKPVGQALLFGDVVEVRDMP